MSRKTVKTVSIDSALVANGIDTSKLPGRENRHKLNPIKHVSVPRDKYINYLTDLDAQQICHRYEWGDLSFGLTSWLIEQMLYHRGSLCGFEYNNSFYILPYTIDNG